MTIDGVARGSAGGDGQFRIEVSGFSSPTCEVTVSDGSTSAKATLSGCTPSGPPKPTFFLRTEVGAAGQQLRFQAAADSSTDLAFVFNWGDGTTVRDPASGFHSPVPPGNVRVEGAEVSHAWSAAGAYTVTITAIDRNGRTSVSDPHTVTIQPPLTETQNDCGSGGDAGNSLEEAMLVTLPFQCTGRFQGSNGIDTRDVFRFNVAEPFRLLTVKLSPPTDAPGITLYDPTGARDVTGQVMPEPIPDFYHTNLCVAAPCDSPPTNFVSVLAWTLEQAGEWKLQIGSVRDAEYTLAVHAGGGGDDCVSGRSPNLVVPAPVDAMNNDFSLVVLTNGEVDCLASMPFADVDRFDSYAFRVEAGERVAISVLPDPPTEPCRGRISALLQRPEQFVPRLSCLEDTFTAREAGIVLFALETSWPQRQDVGYRLRIATSTHHDGDCFTHADAGNSFATAMPIVAAGVGVAVCLGDVSATDEDWYIVPASVGQELSVAGEIYEPDGIKRAVSSPVLIDKTGDWRIRVASGVPGIPTDIYSILVLLRQGVPGHDCNTGANTDAVGMTVTLPVACQGDFLPYAQDPFGTQGDLSDRYNFDLKVGDTVEITVTLATPNVAEYTANLEAPTIGRTVASHRVGNTLTFSYTADETGAWSLFLERAPLVDPFQLGYSFSISVRAAPATPVFLMNIFAPEFVSRGNTFLVETRVGNTGGPAQNVTLTLSASPSSSVRLTNSPFDSFGTNATPTFTVNVGNIPSPGEAQFTWGLRAEKEGPVRLTVTARDGSTGTTASVSITLTIRK